MTLKGEPGKNLTQDPLPVPSPEEGLKRLLAGNRRFREGTRSVDSMLSHLKMAELAAKGQRPFAVVLTCSDSRCPAEMIFDQGLGDLFVIRVAGNVVAPSLLASIEFAVQNFASSIILVLGHSLCGAVTSAVEHAKNPERALASSNLEELIGRIRPAVDLTLREVAFQSADFMSKAILNNTRRSARLIAEQSEIVRELISQGKLAIQGAVLDIATGEVRLV